MTDVQSLLRRHEAFWRHEGAGEPLVRMIPRRERTLFENTAVTPEMIDVEALTPQVGKRDLRKHLVQGDLFHGECPFSRIPWMEALIGCQIRAGADEAMWPVPALGPAFEGRESIVPADDNPWLIKLLALTQALVDSNDGSYLVTHTLQRGPADMLSALLGDSRMGLAFFDNPEEVRQVLMRTADAFVKVARAQYALIPSFHGGFSVWAYGLWAPGSAVRFQSDSSSQLSPRMYQEFVLPADRVITRSFDHSLIDLHSAGTLHLHPVLMKEPDLNGISITMDRYANAPGVQELLPTFETVLAEKSLMVTGELTREEVDLLVRSLPTGNLAISAHVTDKLLFERPV